jgi:hypothetical protein
MSICNSWMGKNNIWHDCQVNKNQGAWHYQWGNNVYTASRLYHYAFRNFQPVLAVHRLQRHSHLQCSSTSFTTSFPFTTHRCMLVELNMSIIEIALCSALQLEGTQVQNIHTLCNCIDFSSEFQPIHYTSCNIIPF